mmetsp:Transcript_65024/g.183558  ORF Transcript_65024/g.183558 Transcript_65024/m.183558 type:complete len:167 (+) Transcript_65024:60-560(+)
MARRFRGSAVSAVVAFIAGACICLRLCSNLAFSAPLPRVQQLSSATERLTASQAWGASSHAPAGRSIESPTASRIFGLGTTEILVILAVGALFFGPEALKDFAKEAGKAAGDLKDVPKAFQDGMEETDKTAKPPAMEEKKEEKKEEKVEKKEEEKKEEKKEEVEKK